MPEPTVLHVIHSLTPGGTERTLVALVHELDGIGIRHVVVPMRQAGPLAERLPDFVGCHPLGCRGRSWSAGIRLGGLARALGAVVIHARNTTTWLDALIASVLSPGTRLLLGFHGLESSAPFSARQRRVARWAARLGARFTCVSRRGVNKLRTEAGIAESRLLWLPNGVDFRRFTPPEPIRREELRRELGLGPSDWVLAIVGSLTPVKGHRTLLEAMELALHHVPELRLLVMGDGGLRKSLEERTRVLGLCDRVQFMGHRDDIPTLLCAVDGYVCSSESEGMSNALLEAMAAGSPVVATDVGDNGLLIRDGIEGYLVPPGEVEALSAAIIRLAGNAEKSRSMGLAARVRAHAFDFYRTVEDYRELYRDAVSTSAVQRPKNGTVVTARRRRATQGMGPNWHTDRDNPSNTRLGQPRPFGQNPTEMSSAPLPTCAENCITP